MFSGIVEATAQVSRLVQHPSQIEIFFDLAEVYKDTRIGDSVAHDGVCLTVHSITHESISFVLGLETLKTTQWNADSLNQKIFNVEKSLRYGDRVHGHQVSGHVEGLGRVTEVLTVGDNLLLKVKLPDSLLPFIWKKGSIAINGVSLTVNDLSAGEVSVGLIPETLQRTNLKQIKKDQAVNIETDIFAKAVSQAVETYLAQKPRNM